MRRALVLLLLSTLAGSAGCSEQPEPENLTTVELDKGPIPKPPPTAPAYRNSVALPDDQLALAALRILGGNVSGASSTSCNVCHSLTRQQLRNWRALSDTAMSSCLTDLAVTSQASAEAMINCLRSNPASPSSDFVTRKLGIHSAALRLPWFQHAANTGFGTSGPKVVAQLIGAVGMPRENSAGIPLTQAQFDTVAEWFARGLPNLESSLPQDPAPTTCAQGVSADVTSHVAAMQTQGWRAINTSNMMAMYGCGGAANPLQCLQTVPLGSAQPYGAGWDIPGRGQLRILADESYSTSYWTRSSPDGRFVAHGVSSVAGSYIIDLQRSGFLIGVNAQYDPTWFPDNSGFVFQGGPRNTCAQSVLTSNPNAISMTEAQCTGLGSIGLYQHVGAVQGGDHFAVDSRFVSDDGGHGVTTRDPFASFGGSAQLGFIPMIYDGTKFTAKPQITLATPYEGDTVLSPSAKLVISRVNGPGDNQLGFVLRKVVATPSGTSYTIQIPEVARYCVSGGKPGFSYDERWLVYHHYITPTDADAIELGFANAQDSGFAPYKTQGGANTYLLELATGTTKRITNMKPGQYALFPHFRSDGWIYADVRDRNTGREYMVASDAALLAEQAPLP